MLLSSTIFVLLLLPLLVGVVSVECEELPLALVSPPLRKSQFFTTDDDDFDEIPDDALYPSSLCVLEEEEEEEEDANHRKHKEKKPVLFSVKLLSRVVVFVVVCAKDFDAAL